MPGSELDSSPAEHPFQELAYVLPPYCDGAKPDQIPDSAGGATISLEGTEPQLSLEGEPQAGRSALVAVVLVEDSQVLAGEFASAHLKEQESKLDVESSSSPPNGQ